MAAPTVVALDVNVLAHETVAASTLYNIFDLNRDPIVSYRLFDGRNGGTRISVNGVEQAAGTVIEVGSLNNVTITANGIQTPRDNSTHEKIYLQAFDGTEWSSWVLADFEIARFGIIEDFSFSGTQVLDTETVSLGNGGHVTLWARPNGIFGQRFDAQGFEIGGEFLASSSSSQISGMEATALADGGFALTWEGQFSSTLGDDVFLQRFDAQANKVGQVLGTFSSGAQETPVIAGLTNGEFVTVWDDGEIFANISGGATDLQVTTTRFSTERDPAVVALPDGGYIVTWFSTPVLVLSPPVALIGQRFDASGNPVGGQFTLDDSVFAAQDAPTLASHVVVSQGFGGVADPVLFVFYRDSTSDYVGKIFNLDGTPYQFGGTPFDPGTPFAPDSAPSVVRLANNNLFVAYHDTFLHEENGVFVMRSGIWGQYFTQQGLTPAQILSNTPFLLSAENNDVLGAPTASLSGGRVLVTWQNETLGVTQGRFFGDPLIGHNYSHISGLSESGSGETAETTDLSRTFVPADFGGDTVIMGTDGVDRPMDGTDADDTLMGLADNDLLRGWGGADILEGGAGQDGLDGGSGVDTASYAGAAARVDARLINGAGFAGDAAGDWFDSIENLTGSAFNDLLIGRNDANAIAGGAGNDSINGLGGDDTIDGGAGNDMLTGGAGADALDGAGGTDTANFSTAGAGVDARLNLGRGIGGDASGDSYTGIENLAGSNFNDLLFGDNGKNVLIGRAGNDNIIGLGGNDTLNGGGGNDVLTGGAGADVLNGAGGSDTANYSTAGAGVDARLNLGRGIGGEAAGDRYTAIENLTGSNFNDLLLGDDGANVLIGRGGNDNISALGGNDTVNGGRGNDVLTGGAGADVLNGAGGSDTANYSTAAGGVDARLINARGFAGDAAGDRYTSIENLSGSNFNDMLVGSNAANILNGRAGNDRLNGAGGNDRLIGGPGNDLLIGGSGNDLLVGGGGNDLFMFGTANGTDRISGFSAGPGPGDRIFIRNGAAAPNDFADIQAAASQVGAHTAIDLGGGDTLFLLGVDVNTLAADDFLF